MRSIADHAFCFFLVLGLVVPLADAQAVDVARVRSAFVELELPILIGEDFPTHFFHSAALGNRDLGFGPIPGSLQRELFVADQRAWRYSVGRIELRDSVLLITYRDFSTRSADEAMYSIETFSPAFEQIDHLTIARRLSRVDRSDTDESMFRSHWSQAELYEVDEGIRIIVWITQAEVEIGRDDPDRWIRLRRDYLVHHNGTIRVAFPAW